MKMSKYALLHLKAIIAVVVLIVTAASGFAQVNRDELQDLPPVTFINYEGPHARVDTREEIRQIGVVIGRQVNERERGQAAEMDAMTLEQRRSHSYQFNVGAANRYFVIHCVSGQDGNKLDADIIGLGVDAGVDHIRNLRVIIQGYLQSAYNYSPSDALLLAEFVTIYNAVYRGNWEYFQTRYKPMVLNHLTSDKAGLSIRYDEWPGRTLIVIPLGASGIGPVDTAAISDARVIEEMRREDDQGVPQRQELVNLIEREAQQAERQAQTERQQARQEERQIQEERRETERERRQVQEEQEEGTITEEQAEERRERISRREEELDRREEAVQERREEAERLEEVAEQRTEQAQEQRQQIAEDQQTAIAQEQPTGVFGVTIERTSPAIMGRVVRLNPTDGSEIRRSPLDLTHIRTITFISGRLIAIAGEARGQGAVRLVEINQTSLEMAKQGDDDILTGSLLWVNGSDLYAITVHEGKNYLGRFNTELVMQARSTIEVHTHAGVTIQQGRLLTQKADGSPLALDPASLAEVR